MHTVYHLFFFLFKINNIVCSAITSEFNSHVWNIVTLNAEYRHFVTALEEKRAKISFIIQAMNSQYK